MYLSYEWHGESQNRIVSSDNNIVLGKNELRRSMKLFIWAVIFLTYFVVIVLETI